jgi:prepilin-type N-terminal cleavage/methylation domain-containing protein
MNRLNNGFSLVELLIVLALFLLIFTLSVVNVDFCNRGASLAQLHHLHTICWYLQQKAITTRKEQRLFIDRNQKLYQCGDIKYQLPCGIVFGVIPGVKGPPAHPTGLITHPITFKNETIIFYPDGIISSGSVYMHDTRGKKLYALTNAVSQISLMRLYRYDNKWSLLI